MTGHDATNDTPPVVAEALVRRFGDIVAVGGIDLEVHRGEIFGFLGPNGAGKSTTVRMLTTLLTPSGGRALVAGYDVVRQANEVRRSIGVALQDAAIDPLMSGRELLRLQSVLHGLDKRVATERGEELLANVGLSGAADRRVGTYSGGMRRRLDLALALVHEPGVLFLDEPTTGLDPNSRSSLWDELRRLNQDLATTIFLTTQYMEEADRLSDRIAIIDGGRIVAEGTPAELKRRIGDPTLQISVEDGHDPEVARRRVLSFGDPVASADGTISVRLRGGAGVMAEVIRALDDSNVALKTIELHNPTLDDVFHKVTGRRLEGAADAGAERIGGS